MLRTFEKFRHMGPDDQVRYIVCPFERRRDDMRRPGAHNLFHAVFLVGATDNLDIFIQLTGAEGNNDIFRIRIDRANNAAGAFDARPK